MSAIDACRTPLLGGHLEQCDTCDLVRCACPDTARSVKAWRRTERPDVHQAELLPVPYFHVVFTLSVPAAKIAFQNKHVVYAILFRAAAEAMREIAANPQHLGAEIGAIAVLHTSGQTLTFHPHLHCIVPGGGLSPDHQRWIACQPKFFLRVCLLSERLRAVFVARLLSSFQAGELRFSGALAALADPAIFAERLVASGGIEWVVYCGKCDRVICCRAVRQRTAHSGDSS